MTEFGRRSFASAALALWLAGLSACAAAPVQRPAPSAAPPSSREVEVIDTALNARIRDEGFNRSRVVETATTLSDVLGPRLAGSPGYREAA
ncbi:MAG TPA: hypothetical protein VKA84_07280, partial [Gemmatimonadaceae bacterium]|nr:hypothetical protein [Gemmatimonadaceae bacterium]